MKTRSVRIPTLFALSTFFGLSGLALADQVVTTLPGGDGKGLLENHKIPGETVDANDNASGAFIRDKECGKRFKDAAAYEKCVKDKLEKAKKKGDH